eukprot:GHVU01143904.1.p1 GENE.GHVU01143904.1~~GHVU01143904.1.p1  ORF type:complete len:162 (-),score=14.94 GHVU01143904.1:442-927(-)
MKLPIEGITLLIIFCLASGDLSPVTVEIDNSGQPNIAMSESREDKESRETIMLSYDPNCSDDGDRAATARRFIYKLGFMEEYGRDQRPTDDQLDEYEKRLAGSVVCNYLTFVKITTCKMLPDFPLVTLSRGQFSSDEILSRLSSLPCVTSVEYDRVMKFPD